MNSITNFCFLDLKNVESKTDIEDDKSSKKDVQQMLDEMMIQTMKETERQQTELDSDLSGTEKIEEVVVKDDGDVKNKSDSDIVIEKTGKPCDSETDNDNKKVQKITSGSIYVSGI